MTTKKIADNLFNPPLELQILECNNPNIEQEYQPLLKAPPNTEVICPKCGSEYLGKRGLTVHGEQRYTCKICNHRFYPNQKWKIAERDNAINCPHCSSSNWQKRGNTENGKQNYSCKDCKKLFGVHPLVDKEGREIKCSDCNTTNYILNGTRGKTSYKCKDCGRKYILNPGGRDDINYLNNINCRWCNSKNFTRFGLSKAGKQQCICKDCHKQFAVGSERPDILVTPEEFDFNHDVWTAKHLGYENGIHKHYKLNFEYIEQPGFKHYF